MISNFNELFKALRAGSKKRMVAAWGVDDHTISAASLAIDKEIVDVTLVGDKDMILDVCKKEKIDPAKFTIIDNKDELKAIAQAVGMVKDGEGDILMKGLCSTDNYMRGILNKERGLLPPKAVLSHVAVIENHNYHKLILISDMAVIPAPDFKQKVQICKYLVKTAKALGIDRPKVAAIAATEQMLVNMPACVEAALLAKMAERGQIPGCVVDGPLAVDVAIDAESVAIKKVKSEVAGDADCLLFPNIESANVFYKVNSKLCKGVRQAAIMVGGTAPCVLSSRADSIDTKLNSIALAALTAK